ncbi:MAG TPA: metal-sensitive transcriptional regulator [Chloroflexota bacterium]|nr:metal-sensitive transcriptional regulator [Chloroflexota bacterium]
MDLELNAETAQNIQERLARIEGQVRGISKMVAERRPCDQVLMQIMAARAALEKVAAAVVSSSIDECLSLPPEEARKVIGRSISMLTQV